MTTLTEFQQNVVANSPLMIKLKAQGITPMLGSQEVYKNMVFFQPVYEVLRVEVFGVSEYHAREIIDARAEELNGEFHYTTDDCVTVGWITPKIHVWGDGQ